MVLPPYPLELSKSQSRTNGKNQRKRPCLEEMEPRFPAFRRENIWKILVGGFNQSETYYIVKLDHFPK